MTSGQLDPRDTFAGMGRSYQERVLQAMMSDGLFADQMLDVLDPRFFDVEYLQQIASKFFEHKRRFKTFPSAEVLEVMVTRDQQIDPTLSLQVREYLKRASRSPSTVTGATSRSPRSTSAGSRR